MTISQTGQTPTAEGDAASVPPGPQGPTPSQHTLLGAVQCSGVGLHSGAAITMRMYPAEPDTGIRLRRTDLPGAPSLPARWTHARQTPLCTTLADDTAHVATVEHLLAALAGTGVDNALVEVDGPEVPIMDGSAAPFVFLIECAGMAAQPAPRRAIRIDKPVAVSAPAEGRRAALVPADRGLSLDVAIAFDTPAIGCQARALALDPATFKRDLARARTFGFLAEVDQLRAAGLALGGSLDNAVVIDGDRVLNDGGLRYPDEFVRHKILDTVGDLSLAGAPIVGRFTGRCTGHALNQRLLAALFADPAAWSWTDAAPLGPDGALPAAGPTLPERAVAQRA